MLTHGSIFIYTKHLRIASLFLFGLFFPLSSQAITIEGPLAPTGGKDFGTGVNLYRFKFDTSLCANDIARDYLDDPNDNDIDPNNDEALSDIYYDASTHGGSRRISAVGQRWHGLVLPKDTATIDELILFFHGTEIGQPIGWRFYPEGKDLFSPESLCQKNEIGDSDIHGRFGACGLVESAKNQGHNIGMVLFQRDQWNSNKWFYNLPAGVMECVMTNIDRALTHAGILSTNTYNVSLAGQSAGGRPVSGILTYGLQTYARAIYTDACYGSWCEDGARAARAEFYYYYIDGNTDTKSGDKDGDRIIDSDDDEQDEGPRALRAYNLQPARSTIIRSGTGNHTTVDTYCATDHLLDGTTLPLINIQENGRCSGFSTLGSGPGVVLFPPSGIPTTLNNSLPQSSAWYRASQDASSRSGQGTRRIVPPTPVRTNASDCANIGVTLSARSALETLGSAILGKDIPASIQTNILCAPRPRISIPGLTLSNTRDALNKLTIYDQDGNLSGYYIPFLGEYITAIYRYSVALIGIICVFMIIIAGIQWTLYGANPSVIDTAKERIQHAITGLILIVSSYTILYLINPELTEFKHLKLDVINTMQLEGEDEIVYTPNEQQPSESSGNSRTNGEISVASAQGIAYSPSRTQTTHSASLANPQNFCFPVASGSFVNVSYNWADRRTGRCHVGIDIYTQNPFGIIAIDDGTVVQIIGDSTSPTPSGGNRMGNFSTCGQGTQVGILVDHPNLGYTILYGELERNSIGVATGDRISKGQFIGYAKECKTNNIPMVHIEAYTLGDYNFQTLNWDITGNYSREKCLANKPRNVLDHTEFIRALETSGQRCDINAISDFAGDVSTEIEEPNYSE